MKACTRHVRIRTSVCFFLTVLFALTSVLCVSPKKAYAKTDPANPDLVPDKVIVYDNGDVFSSFGGRVKDKEAAVRVLEPSSQAPKSITRSLYARKDVPFGNAYAYATFSSTMGVNLLGTSVTVTQATSHAAWMGSLPQSNATHAQLFDSVTWNSVGGASISISLSGGGGGWSVQSHTASWTGPLQYNCWEVSHTFGGLTGSGLLYSVVESSTGDFWFDSSHSGVTPTASQAILY